MLKVGRCVSCLILAVILAPILSAQTKDASAAPVPAQIASAKKVFISNAGVDAISLSAFEHLGEPNKPYNQFYAAMKNWGHYDLVSSPSDADLVFEIRFDAPLTGSDKLNTYAPQYNVTILDVKTHFILWSLAEPVGGALRKSAFLKNLDQGVGKLMDKLQKLATPTMTAAQDRK